MLDTEEEKQKFFESLLVKDEDVPRVFFDYYEQLARLMEVEEGIEREGWTFFTGLEGALVSMAFCDKDLYERIRSDGSKRIFTDLVNQFKKPDSSDKQLQDKIRVYLKEIIHQTVVPAHNILIIPEKLLVYPLGSLRPILSHEAGHILYEKESCPQEGNEKYRNEIFALFAEDFAYRELGADLFYFRDNFELKDDYLQEVYINVYRIIAKACCYDFNKISHHMKEFFKGKRGLGQCLQEDKPQSF